MSRGGAVLCGALCLLVSMPEGAKAQEKTEPTVYRFVALWSVPRDKWMDFEEFGEKHVQPVFERMLANGTIIDWSLSTRVVHEEEGPTHGAFWSATSIAALERVREELLKLPPNPAAAGAKHFDLLVQSIVYRARTTGATSGYLYVSWVKLKPGMGREWEAIGKKYFEPVLEELLKNGTLLAFGIEFEYVHTQDLAWRILWYVTPSAEGEDKVSAALNAVFDHDGAVILPALEATTVRREHRDGFWRLRNYAHK